MAVPARRAEPEHSMEVEARLARLEERSDHIRRDVGETKADVRRLDAKIDAVKNMVVALAEKLAFVDVELSDRISSVEVKLTGMEASIIKWIVGTMTALAALVFGIAKFVS